MSVNELCNEIFRIFVTTIEIQLFNEKRRGIDKTSSLSNSNTLMYVAIALFALLNIAFGLLYQVSRDIICYTELVVLVPSSILFWVFFNGPIRKFVIKLISSKWHLAKKTALFFAFSIVILLLNLVVAQLSVLLIVTYLLEIQTPSTNLIVATLTYCLFY